MKRVGGIIEFKIDGVLYSAKGAFTYNLGIAKRATVVGSDRIHGYTETPQPGFIEGATTDSADISMTALVGAKNVTATLTLPSGKIIAVRDAVYVGDGTGNTEEGEVDLRFEGEAEEIRA